MKMEINGAFNKVSFNYPKLRGNTHENILQCAKRVLEITETHKCRTYENTSIDINKVVT